VYQLLLGHYPDTNAIYSDTDAIASFQENRKGREPPVLSLFSGFHCRQDKTAEAVVVAVVSISLVKPSTTCQNRVLDRGKPMGLVAKANLSPQERAEFEVLESMGEDIEGCLMLRFECGWTALQIALEMRDDPSIIHGLAAVNADMNAVMPIGTSPLVFALMNTKIKSARALIACGANVNDRDSPLLYAVTAEDEETIKTLIERGANVNDGGRCGMTPLHAACQIQGGGREKIIRMLIEAGADRTLRNASGETAADLFPSLPSILSDIEAASLIKKYGDGANRSGRKGGAL